MNGLVITLSTGTKVNVNESTCLLGLSTFEYEQLIRLIKQLNKQGAKK